jgi:hypothetical protein
VAYQHGANLIRGFYVTLNHLTGADWWGVTYNLSDVNGTKPLIAWGKHSGRYLLTHTFTSFGIKFPVYTHVHDLNPGVDPYAHPAVTLINFVGWSNDKYPTGVAYDPCTEKFIVLFDHVFKPDPADFVVDVWAAAIHKTNPVTYWYNHVAYRWSEERGGGISFVTDDNLPAACGSMDKLVYTYTHINSKRIYASDLRGNNSITAPSYQRDHHDHHHQIAWFLLPVMNPYWQPSISSGSTRAEMLVVFNAEWIAPADPNYDVWGAIVKVPVKYLFPLMMR